MSEESITAAATLPPELAMQIAKQKRLQRVTNEKYYRTHPELRDMIAAFMSALLAEKPENVADFAEQFFTQPDLARQLGYTGWTRPATPVAADEADEGLDDEYEMDEMAMDTDVGGASGMDAVDLEAMLINLFKEADQDGSGALDFDEFVALMNTADVGLGKAELQMLVAEADEDSDGKVTYTEFVPLAVQVIQTMMLKQRADEAAADMTEELRFMAEEILGHSPEEIEALVQSHASSAEAGLLSRAQVKAMLKRPQLALSKQQVNQAAGKLTYDAAGMVAVSELASGLFEILITTLASMLAHNELGEEGVYLTQLCEYYDKEDTGFIDPRVLKDALAQEFCYISRLQLNALTSDPSIPTNDDGRIAWREYMPKLSILVKGMGDPAAFRERETLRVAADIQPVALMNGKDREAMTAMLQELFAQADADGSGALDRAEFGKCLEQTGLIEPWQIPYLYDRFDVDGDGTISISEFIELGYEVLLEIAREKAITERLFNSGDHGTEVMM